MVFGGIQWNKDETKVVFVAEVAEIAAYKNPWDQEKPKEEVEKDEKKDEEKKEEHWQEEKFLYTNDFGENLVGKKSPGVFVFDLETNKVERVVGIPEYLFPCCPIFDQTGEGLVFHAIELKNKKLGAVFCLNRPTALYSIAKP